MAFNSLAYALLLTFTVVWMAIGPSRALMLIVASLIFYAAAGPFDMLVFLGAVILNWVVQVAVPADRRRIGHAVVCGRGHPQLGGPSCCSSRPASHRGRRYRQHRADRLLQIPKHAA